MGGGGEGGMLGWGVRAVDFCEKYQKIGFLGATCGWHAIGRSFKTEQKLTASSGSMVQVKAFIW